MPLNNIIDDEKRTLLRHVNWINTLIPSESLVSKYSKIDNNNSFHFPEASTIDISASKKDRSAYSKP